MYVSLSESWRVVSRSGLTDRAGGPSM